MRNNKGFTLIELMIVVAIIGILAAIAIPSFLAMQQRAKRSELPMNLDAIRTAEKAYQAEYDTFEAAALNPATVAPAQQDWGTPGGGWDLIGWSPDGRVRGQYEVSVPGVGQFLATGSADIDGDGVNSQYQASESLKGKILSAQDVY